MRSARGLQVVDRGHDPSVAPMLAAMELLGQRWILRVIWELQSGGPLGFLELRRRMGNCSSSMLSERLQQLAAAEVVTKNATGAWELTAIGAQLAGALCTVWDWSKCWRSRPPQAKREHPARGTAD